MLANAVSWLTDASAPSLAHAHDNEATTEPVRMTCVSGSSDDLTHPLRLRVFRAASD
jgi:hypothetical protein